MGRPSKKNERTTVQIEIPQPVHLPRNGHANQLMSATLNRLRLALSEIRIVRPKGDPGGKERIANGHALTRTRLAYMHAAQAIGLARQALGLTEREQQQDPPHIVLARVKLEEYRQAIGKLENLEVEDDS